VSSDDFYFNDVQIQAMDSIYCGYYAMGFLIYMSHYTADATDNINNIQSAVIDYLKNFKYKLTDNYKLNDNIIKKLFLQ
jgi:hypothetical protein